MKAPAFAYAKPSSLEQVFELLERHGEDARLLAGGQSLIAALNLRLSAPEVLIDINGVPDLDGVTLAGDTLRIGALTRHRTLEHSPLIAQHLPLIHAAMPHIAHAAIRNRGTFGGSIAFADPAAELPACAVALDAQLVLASRDGERRVPAREFFKGLYATALAPDEVITAGEFRLQKKPRRSVFLELARRHGDYASVGVAAVARYDGAYGDVDIVVFGVGASPTRAVNVAGAIDGHAISEELLEKAQAAVASDIQPLADLYHTGATRLHLARVLAGRAIAELAPTSAADD